jgi:hypothetical protein
MDRLLDTKEVARLGVRVLQESQLKLQAKDAEMLKSARANAQKA